MKRSPISLLVVLLCLFSSAFAQQPAKTALTADDYARAERMLGYGTAPLIDRAVVRPTFLPDGRFWYRVLTPTGSEYVMINPADGSRKVGADAAAIGVTPPAGGGGFGRRGAAGEGVVSPDGKR